MIQLLFTLIFAEMALILLFMFKNPLRKLVIMGLDLVKRGRGPIFVKTVSATVFVGMMASVYNAVVIQSRWMENGEVNPTDQILFAKHLLEASLMGFSLFLGLMMDRLHNYIRELRMKRKSSEGVMKQNRAFSEQIKALEREVNSLNLNMKKLEAQLEEKTKDARRAETNANALKKQSEGFLVEYKQLKTQLEEKAKEASSAEASVHALEKQSEGLLLEYDRLLEENQNLRSQLQSLDRKLSYSENKKVM